MKIFFKSIFNFFFLGRKMYVSTFSGKKKKDYVFRFHSQFLNRHEKSPESLCKFGEGRECYFMPAVEIVFNKQYANSKKWEIELSVMNSTHSVLLRTERRSEKKT